MIFGFLPVIKQWHSEKWVSPQITLEKSRSEILCVPSVEDENLQPLLV